MSDISCAGVLQLGFGFVTIEGDGAVDKVVDIHFHQLNGKTVWLLPLPHYIPHTELGIRLWSRAIARDVVA